MRVRCIVWGLVLAYVLFNTVSYEHVDIELAPYIKDLKELTSAHCPSIKYPNQFIVELEDLSKDGWLGVCYTNGIRAQIKIDKEHFTKGSEADIISTLAHELAHCVLGLDLREDEKDYMNPYYVPLTKFDVLNQYITDVRKTCND